LTGIDQIEHIADPEARALEVGRRLGQLPDFQERLRRIRQAAVLEMRGEGLSYAEIGRRLKLHRNRVQQIAEGRPGGGKGGAGKHAE